jgi:hypothetical protein
MKELAGLLPGSLKGLGGLKFNLNIDLTNTDVDKLLANEAY